MVLLAILLFLVLCIILFFRCRALWRRIKYPATSSTSAVELFLREYADEMPTRFSLSNLKKITNNFAEKLGEGGYGVVYKGKLQNGTPIAVKLLDRHRHSEVQFMNEVATIGYVHHVNLVRLLGYCFESFTSALLYEYMPNGSLDRFIFAAKEKLQGQGQLLSWGQLYSIALGAARGIAYLHHDCYKRIIHFDIKPHKRIIHFDIKPHNILLDADFTQKVSDFGLAKLCRKRDDHISMTAARGTPGYVAPSCVAAIWVLLLKNQMSIVSECFCWKWLGAEKTSILRSVVPVSYTFLSGLSNCLRLRSWELGMRLRGGELEAEDEEKAKRLTKIGVWCIQYHPRDRPSMGRVVQMLEGNADDVANPPMPFNSSSSAAPEIPLCSTTEESSSIEPTSLPYSTTPLRLSV